MKIFKTLSSTILFLFTVMTMSAQSKVAHIDLQALVQEMPEFIEAQAQLQKLSKTYETDIQASMKELQTKSQTYSADAQNQTDLTNETRGKELQGMEQNIQQYQQQAAADVQKKNQDLIAPILAQANEAIKKVADAQGFDYVLNSAPNAGVVLINNGKDLIEDVKKELGF